MNYMKWSALYPCFWFISNHSLIWGHFRSEVVESSWFIWKSATPKIQCFKSSCSPLNIQKYHKIIKIPLMGCPNQLNHVKSMEIPHFQMPTWPTFTENPPKTPPNPSAWPALASAFASSRARRAPGYDAAAPKRRRRLWSAPTRTHHGTSSMPMEALGWSIGSQKGAEKKEMTLEDMEECLVLIQAILQNGE